MGQCLEHGNIPLSQKKIPHIFIPLLVPMIILLLSFDYPTPIIIPLQSHKKKNNIIWTAMFDTSRQVPTRFRSLLPPGIAARKHRENCGYVKEMSLETGDKNG